MSTRLITLFLGVLFSESLPAVAAAGYSRIDKRGAFELVANYIWPSISLDMGAMLPHTATLVNAYSEALSVPPEMHFLHSWGLPCPFPTVRGLEWPQSRFSPQRGSSIY